MQKTVSFDFDNTLRMENGNDHKIMINKLFEYHNSGYQCVIVTSRNPQHESEDWIQKNEPERVSIQVFINKHNLPIKDCYYTNHQPKGPILKIIGAMRHYDDEVENLQSANKYGIEAIQVTPDGYFVWKE